MLPDFLVIGAYKSGTTTLQQHLAAHPQVFVPKRKEPNFFAYKDAEPGVGPPAAARAITRMEDYLRLFEGVTDERAVGEVSPEYLAHPGAAEAIHRRLPAVRLVAVLRNPVERAYSDFLMYRRDGLEQEDDFGRALDAQDARQAQGLPTGYYVATGFYGAQLARYTERFCPEQLSVHLFEDLVRTPDVVMGDIFRFLGVDGIALQGGDVYNASGIPTNPLVRAAYGVRRRLGPMAGTLVPARLRPGIERLMQRGLRKDPMPASARARLAGVYAEDVALLERLIGRDLSHWLAPNR